MKNNTKPHLLFIYPNQFGYHTDSYMYCLFLRDKFEISYICFDQGLTIMDLPGINILYQSYNLPKIKRLILFFHNIIAYSKKIPIDILFVVQFKFCFLIALFVRSKANIIDYRTGDLSENNLIRYFKNRIIFFDSLFYDHISVISEGLRDMLGLNKTKAFILPLGGDVISTMSHSYNRMDMLYVGTLSKRNIHKSIEGLALFLSRYEDRINSTTYTIIGFGDKKDEEKIKSTILKWKLQNVVTFKGRKRLSDLQKYFDICNIGISYVPQTPYFNFQPSTKTFEYANSGLYIIATNTFENRKMINENNGILCEDAPEDFAGALEKVYIGLKKINENIIRNSLSHYKWVEIIDKILRPYLEGILVK